MSIKYFVQTVNSGLGSDSAESLYHISTTVKGNTVTLRALMASCPYISSKIDHNAGNSSGSDDQDVTYSDGVVEEMVIDMLEAYAMTSERQVGKHYNLLIPIVI